MSIENGLVHVYTGFAKGKTTAAYGLAVRALGCGLRVLIIQFLKGGGRVSCESRFLSSLPDVDIIIFPDQRHPIFMKPDELDMDRLVASIRAGLELARQKVNSAEYDLVILDEVNNCMKEGWLDTAEMASLIKEKPQTVELVLTGRSCPNEIIELADYVTEMKLVKHPAQSGTKARRGIEF